MWVGECAFFFSFICFFPPVSLTHAGSQQLGTDGLCCQETVTRLTQKSPRQAHVIVSLKAKITLELNQK